MKIEDQVCTLEQAKKLKELGINQDSYFSWFGDETMRLMDNGKEPATYGGWLFIATTSPANSIEEQHREDVCTTKPIAAAFTVSELGLMISGIEYEAWGHSMFMTWFLQSEKQWRSGFRNPANQKFHKQGLGFRTEAEDRAQTLIYLLRNNLTTASEVNELIK